MKKRFIALLLCCVMLLTLSPSLISAASATDISGTTQSTEGQVPSGEATILPPIRSPMPITAIRAPR